MIIHDEKTTYHSLLTIFIKQCYETLIDVAKETGGKLPFRTNFILDEFANMPPLKDVDSMVSAARSRDIRFTFIIQNFAQLNDVYGKEVAEVIKGNCGNWVYLISTEMAALEEISKMCGEIKSKEKEKTASTPLVTVTDLQKLKLGEAIIIRLRKYPFKTKYKPDNEMDWGIKRTKAKLPEREEKPISLFDIKKYVTEEKKKTMLEGIENGPSKDKMGFPDFSLNGLPDFNTLPKLGNDFNSPMPNFSNPFLKGAPPTNEEIDKMIAEIDKKLKELDEEEKKQKKEIAQKPIELKEKTKEIEPKPKENPPVNKKVEEKKEDQLPNKPKINIDVDSVIVNDNIITDDEFFDDFFGDDEK